MMDRAGQTWEVKTFMNGERVFVVVESTEGKDRNGDAFMNHRILQITGNKQGRFLLYTEEGKLTWEMQDNMLRLDV